MQSPAVVEDYRMVNRSLSSIQQESSWNHMMHASLPHNNRNTTVSGSKFLASGERTIVDSRNANPLRPSLSPNKNQSMRTSIAGSPYREQPATEIDSRLISMHYNRDPTRFGLNGLGRMNQMLHD